MKSNQVLIPVIKQMADFGTAEPFVARISLGLTDLLNGLNIDEAKIELRYKETSINIGGPIEDERFMNEVQKTLTFEILGSVKDGEVLNIYWNDKDGEINITKM